MAADVIPTLLIAAIILAVIAGLLGTTLIIWVYAKDPSRPRSWVLMMVVYSAIIVEVSTIYLGAITGYRVTHPQEVFPEVVTAISRLLVVALASLPAVWAVWMVRRSR